MTADWVVDELRKLASANMADYMKPGPDWPGVARGRPAAGPNGSAGRVMSGRKQPERLRGPQHDAAWCDELGAWRYPEAWDMLMFGMRLGADPRTVVTTTPRPRN